MEKLFVIEGSIVRKIWGNADIALFIFAGAAAEFALNKAVDWLYFTGRLPADPLGRLFSTITYACEIIFSNEEDAFKAIDKITVIHKGVEKNRGSSIPDWAYRDVLFMLIDYSIRSFELLERKLEMPEKEEVFDVFYRVGIRMQLSGLPADFSAWETMRVEHLQQDLLNSAFTDNLYEQYQKHLGTARFAILKQIQQQLVPERVRELLNLDQLEWITPWLYLYKQLRLINSHKRLRNALLPTAYKDEILRLDRIG